MGRLYIPPLPQPTASTLVVVEFFVFVGTFFSLLHRRPPPCLAYLNGTLSPCVLHVDMPYAYVLVRCPSHQILHCIAPLQQVHTMCCISIQATRSAMSLVITQP